jgi:hypothetical protein
MIKEDFLHFIWKYKLYDPEYFFYRNNRIEVVETGQHNLSSGPDFFNSKIRIGDTLWVGNVELHVKASDWYKHKHETDPVYDNIILHVVYDPDIAVYRKNGEEIPFVRLAFHPKLLKQYENLLNEKENKPCYPFFAKIDRVYYRDWIGKLGIGRLERRVDEILDSLKLNHYDWNETLYIYLAAAMGANQNREPFKILARSVPLRFIYKHRDNPLILNAAFFGQAGFLDETLSDDYYYTSLQKEYQSLKKYLPEPLPGKYVWKLMRIRPAAFPVVRIPQLIALVKNSFPLIERIIQMAKVNEISSLFSESIKNYWTDHFLYGQPERRPEYLPSPETFRTWILNAIIPVLFTYGKIRNNENFTEYAVDLLEQLPPENNEILKKWNKFGICAENAFDSQSLIELKSRYCDLGRCTECMTGQKYLSNAGKER